MAVMVRWGRGGGAASGDSSRGPAHALLPRGRVTRLGLCRWGACCMRLSREKPGIPTSAGASMSAQVWVGVPQGETFPVGLLPEYVTPVPQPPRPNSWWLVCWITLLCIVGVPVFPRYVQHGAKTAR